jgi:hypothetical protein
MRNNNISQDGCAWENNLEIWSTSIFSAEALGLLASSGSRVV